MPRSVPGLVKTWELRGSLSFFCLVNWWRAPFYTEKRVWSLLGVTSSLWRDGRWVVLYKGWLTPQWSIMIYLIIPLNDTRTVVRLHSDKQSHTKHPCPYILCLKIISLGRMLNFGNSCHRYCQIVFQKAITIDTPTNSFRRSLISPHPHEQRILSMDSIFTRLWLKKWSLNIAF